jgi:hypothetical protein
MADSAKEILVGQIVTTQILFLVRESEENKYENRKSISVTSSCRPINKEKW